MIKVVIKMESDEDVVFEAEIELASKEDAINFVNDVVNLTSFIEENKMYEKMCKRLATREVAN